MAGITTATANSFKAEILEKIHDIVNDNIYLALIKVSPTGTYDQDSTNYSDITGNTDETSGTGYVAGGFLLTGNAVTIASDTAIVDFDDVVATGCTFTFRGAMLYNASAGNKCIAVYDYGVDRSLTAEDITIKMPAAGASTAIIRVQ